MSRRRMSIVAAFAAPLAILGAQPAIAGSTIVYNVGSRAIQVQDNGVWRTLPAGATSRGYLGWMDVDTIRRFAGDCAQISPNYGPYRPMPSPYGISESSSSEHVKSYLC